MIHDDKQRKRIEAQGETQGALALGPILDAQSRHAAECRVGGYDGQSMRLGNGRNLEIVKGSLLEGVAPYY